MRVLLIVLICLSFVLTTMAAANHEGPEVGLAPVDGAVGITVSG